jgi:heptosyltransferase-2
VHSDPNKILVIQTAFIGDVIYTTPLIREVKRRYPKAHLAVMVAPRGEFVLSNNPHVDELLIMDKRGKDRGLGGATKWAKEIRARGFDLVIAPHRSWRSTYLAWRSGAQQKVGFRKGLGRWIYHPAVKYNLREEPRYVERKLNLIRALGWGDSSAEVEMFVGDQERAAVQGVVDSERMGGKRLAALNPGSQWATKQWLLEYYLELGSRLGRELGFQVILLGSQQEKEMLRWLEQHMNPRPLNCAGDSLAMAAAWLERCEVYVGGDTGPTYMAVAVGTKHVVALYGPTPENVFDFRDTDAVIVKDGLRCRPCSPHGPRKCPIGTLECQTGIYPGHVFKIITEKRSY